MKKNKKILLSKNSIVRLLLTALAVSFCMSVCIASSERELGMPREHLNDQLFQALKANQSKVVELWLEARETEGPKRKALEDRALKLQNSLAQDVNDMKARFRSTLELTKQSYEAAIKQANPQLTDDEREALEATILDTKQQLRSWKYYLEEFKKRYYLDRAKSRREIEEAKQEGIRIYEQCLDILKREEGELRKAKEQLSFIQKSQAYDSLDQMIEEEAREDETTKEHMKSLAGYFKGDQADAQKWVDHYSKAVAEMQQKISTGDFRPQVMGYSVNEWRTGFIEPMQNGLAEREKAFRNSETYEQRRAITTINYLQASLDAQNEKLKGKSAKIQRLEEEMAYLQKMIDATFIPEVPDPKETLDYICDAFMGLGQVVSDLGQADEILKLIKLNNPWSILDYACERAYGKSFVSLLAEKTGLDKYMTNKWVKMAIEGKLVANALREEVARNILPQDVVDKLQALDQMRRDPKTFVKEKINAEVDSMVEANPFLKDTIQKVEQIRNFMTEPQTIQDEIEKEFLKKVEQVGKDTVLYKQLNETYEKQRQKLQAALEKQRQHADALKKGVATAVDRAVKESIVNQYAPELMERAGKVKSTVQNYVDSVSDDTQD